MSILSFSSASSLGSSPSHSHTPSIVAFPSITGSSTARGYKSVSGDEPQESKVNSHSAHTTSTYRPHTTDGIINSGAAGLMTQRRMIATATSSKQQQQASSSATATAASLFNPSMPRFELDKFLRTSSNLQGGGGSGGGMNYLPAALQQQQKNYIASPILSVHERSRAYEVLKMETYERDTNEIALLSNYLASFDYFASFSPSLRNDIAGIISLRHIRKDEVIYTEGEEAYHFFIVLSGRVATRMKDLYAGKGHQGKSKVGATATSSSLSSTAASSTTSFSSSHDISHAAHSNGTFLSTTPPHERGECFGLESMGSMNSSSTSATASSVTATAAAAAAGVTSLLAAAQQNTNASSLTLLTDDQRIYYRSQTKVACERTELLVIDVRDYRSILKMSINQEAQEKIEFVGTIPLFESCSIRELHRIASCLQVIEYKKNSIIFKQDDMSDAMYFIQKGECRVIHKMVIDGGGGSGSGRNRKSRDGFSSPSSSHSSQQTQLLDLGRLSSRWHFGEIGVLRNTTRSASIYAETNVTLMRMSKEDVVNRLPAVCMRYLEDYISTFYTTSSIMKEQWLAEQRWQEFKGKMVKMNKKQLGVMEMNGKFGQSLNRG